MRISSGLSFSNCSPCFQTCKTHPQHCEFVRLPIILISHLCLLHGFQNILQALRENLPIKEGRTWSRAYTMSCSFERLQVLETERCKWKEERRILLEKHEKVRV